MIHCPSCQQLATKRDDYDERGRQRYGYRPCHRDFTATSTSAFSGYRWPANVILAAVRWYASYPLSAKQVMQLIAERYIDVSARTVLNWVQTFGPQLAKAVYSHRRRLRALVPRYQPTKASPHDTTRAVMVAMYVLGAQLQKAV